MLNKYSQSCKSIRKYFGLSQNELALQTGVSRVTIARLENEMFIPKRNTLDAILSFAYRNGLNLNEINCQLLEGDKNDNVLLFHGSRDKIISSFDLNHSKGTNDFGKAFYAGETYKQAAAWVCAYPNSYVYSFYFNSKKDLKYHEFSADIDWMLAICYYRGRINEYSKHPKIQKIIKMVEEADYIIAPIADNIMYETLNEFANKEITDEQCRHCLSANSLGRQYVFLTEKALNNINTTNEMVLCSDEKSTYMQNKNERKRISIDKTRIAKMEYRREGKYLDELLR